MERREFLKVAFGVAAGVAALGAGAQAAPLSPQPLGENGGSPREEIRPAVISGDEAARVTPEQVHWGRGHHWGWRHRHWGWRHRRWHHRHYW